MGTYIAQSDINARVGEANVIAWSNRDNTTTTVDAAAVTASIAWAEQTVEDRFRGSRYAVPLTATSGTLNQVVDWCAWLAAFHLYSARGLRDEGDDTAGKMQGAHDRVMREISSVLAGTRELNAESANDDPTAPVAM